MNARAWWNGLETRERRTLTLGGIALGIIFFVFVIWLPAHRGADAMAEKLADQRVVLAWMQQAAVEAKALQGAGGGAQAGLGGQNLFSFVDKSARDAGLGSAIRQVEPTTDQRVRVNLQLASFDTLMSWLVTLSTRYGIEANQLSVRRGTEPGKVDAQIVLEGPAR